MGARPSDVKRGGSTGNCSYKDAPIGQARLDLLVIPLKELLFFATWFYAATTLHVKWRDKAIRLGKNSTVSAVVRPIARAM